MDKRDSATYPQFYFTSALERLGSPCRSPRATENFEILRIHTSVSPLMSRSEACLSLTGMQKVFAHLCPLQDILQKAHVQFVSSLLLKHLQLITHFHVRPFEVYGNRNFRCDNKEANWAKNHQLLRRISKTRPQVYSLDLRFDDMRHNIMAFLNL